MKDVFNYILSQEDVAEANRFARKVTKIWEDRGPNYTGLHSPTRCFVGKCGEMTVTGWADHYWLDFDPTITEDGMPDDQDHLFHTQNGDVTVNVKNSHHPRAKYLMQPVSQDEKYMQDYYIGCTGQPHSNGTFKMTLWGAISHEQWVEERVLTERAIPTYEILLDDLPISMLELAEIMR